VNRDVAAGGELFDPAQESHGVLGWRRTQDDHDRFGLELLVFTWPALATRILRVSAQVYNAAGDYERVAEALGVLRRESA